MNHKETIHELLERISTEVLEFIKEQEPSFPDRWVPATHIGNTLELSFLAVPKDNIQYGPKGWLFAIIARMLEDQGKIIYRKSGGRTFYRSQENV